MQEVSRTAGAISLIHLMVSEIVADTGAILIRTSSGPDADILIHLRVADKDLGKVVGRGGRVARALRIILRAMGTAHGLIYRLDIIGEVETSQ